MDEKKDNKKIQNIYQNNLDLSDWNFGLDMDRAELLAVEKPAYSFSKKSFRKKACVEILSLLETVSGNDFYIKKNIFSVGLEYHKCIQFLIDKKIIKDFPVLLPKFSDEIKIFNVASCSIHQLKEISDGDLSDTAIGGSDIHPGNALFKAAMEGFERYCFQAYKYENLLRASFDELRDKNALRPQDALGYLNKNISDSDSFYWVKGISYLTGKSCFIPAQLVFWNYNFHKEPGLRPSISNGCAAGGSFEEAMYRGLCETIERDAFMIHWLKKITPPKIDLANVKDKTIQEILMLCKRYHFDVFALDITTDLKIPVIAAVVIDKTSQGPTVTVGASCDFNTVNALLKAISEAFFVRLYARSYWLDNKELAENLVLEEYFNFKKSLMQNERTLFWSKQETIKYIEFFINGALVPLKENESADFPIKQKLSRVLEIFQEKNHEVFYYNPLKDLSFGKELEKENFFAIRAIVPDLQPLFLQDDRPCLRGKRLEETPALLGQPRDKDFFYHIPHPFP